MEWLALGLIALLIFGAKSAVRQVVMVIDRKSFYQAFMAAAKNVDWNGIDPLFALGQSDLETGGGSGNVFKQTKNLFSLTRGSTWKGPVYHVASSGLDFRAYPSLEASMTDWVRLMHIPLYKNALAALLAHDIAGFAAAVKAAGYDVSSPTYAADLVSRYNSAKAALA